MTATAPTTAQTHVIVLVPVSAQRTDDYGITHSSVYVYENPRSGGHPTRIELWDNTRRINPDNGGPVRYGQCGPLPAGGNGRYIDPSNLATDDEVSILVSPESMCIDSRGTGTGSKASGQVWAPDRETLRDGDTVVLVVNTLLAVVSERRYTVSIPRFSNGHGRLVPIAV